MLFDSHCHLDDERFNEDRDDVILDISRSGPAKCMCVGSDLESSRRCIALSEKYDFIYAACGVHPHEAKDAPEDYLVQLESLLSHKKVHALGEIGLDYYYDLSPRDVQKKVMNEQIDLAVRLDVPVIFHIRDAHGDMIDILRARKQLPRGIIHCFSGSAETAAEYLRMGFYISFAGPVTFKKAPHLWEAAAVVPLDRLMIETDSPYLAPEPVRGRRNDPRNVKYVAEKLAALKGISPDELAGITYNNAMTVYSI
ncbi:MAG: hydrolase TatD [Clostridiales bacterium]|nr:hydrolase TatD [Clostridiales bacterium]